MTDQNMYDLIDELWLNESDDFVAPSQIRRFALALLAKAIPEGFVVVPKEPNVQMWEAGMNCYSPDDTQGDYLEKAYAAMIAAAPSP